MINNIMVVNDNHRYKEYNNIRAIGAVVTILQIFSCCLNSASIVIAY